MERRATQSERFWQISVVLHFIRFSLCHKKAWKTVSARLFRFFKTLLYFFPLLDSTHSKSFNREQFFSFILYRHLDLSPDLKFETKEF